MPIEAPKGVVLTGQASEKIYYGQPRLVVPYVGFDSVKHVGASVDTPDFPPTPRLWGLAGPVSLIRVWRAMKLLEAADSIGDGSSIGSYFGAGEVYRDDQYDHVLPLQLHYRPGSKFWEVREQVLQLAPINAELETMVNGFRENEITAFNDRELLDEVRSGRMVHTPLVQKIVDDEVEWRRQFQERHDAEKAQRLAKERQRIEGSLGARLGRWVHRLHTSSDSV